MHDILKGKVVTLRPITMDDTDLIVEWRNTPSVQRNFIFQETFTREMHEKWMNTKVASGEVVQYIITLADSGTEIGSVYLRDVDAHTASAEIGIFIGEAGNRSRGAGTESLRLLADYAFEKMGLHRIMGRVLSTNVASIRAAEKSGLRVEGIFHDMVKLNGRYENVVFLARLNPAD